MSLVMKEFSFSLGLRFAASETPSIESSRVRKAVLFCGIDATDPREVVTMCPITSAGRNGDGRGGADGQLERRNRTRLFAVPL